MHTLTWPGPNAETVLRRAEDLIDGRPGRRVLGIAGAPAGGKSTFTDWLVQELSVRHPGRVAHVGMDAFHLGHRVLVQHDLVAVKGAPHTFDAVGYVALLARIRADREPVYAPVFHREIEDSVAHEVEISAAVELVVTEGNYLLLDTPPWDRVRPQLDQAWFVQLDEQERRRRLLARHLSYGHEPAEAAARTHGSDEANARLVARTGARADLRIDMAVPTPPPPDRPPSEFGPTS